MDINEVKSVVDRINDRTKERKRLDLLTQVVDDRTDVNGYIVVEIEGQALMCEAKEVKKLITKTKNLLTDDADITRLKSLV